MEYYELKPDNGHGNKPKEKNAQTNMNTRIANYYY